MTTAAAVDARPSVPRDKTAGTSPPAALRTALPLLPAVATVLLLCVPGSREDAGGGVRLTPADVASAVLVAVCAALLLRERRRPLPRHAAVVLAAPAVGAAIATAASHDPAASLPGFVRWLQVFVLLPAALVLLLRSRRDFWLVAGAVVALALVQGAVGVHQYATVTGASYQGRDVRAVGTFGPLEIMGMATVVAFGVVLALSLGLSAAAPRRWRSAALACAVLLLAPLTVSFSRGAWIATAVAGGAVLLLAGPRLAVRAAAVLLAAAVVLTGTTGTGSDMLAERLTSITRVTGAPDRSVTDRYALWGSAVRTWRGDPATGVGPKGFPRHRDGHASLGLSSASDTGGAGRAFRREPLLSPHNMYLLVLSEQGLAGAVATLGGWAALLVCGLRRLWRQRHVPGPAGAAGCGLAAVGLLVWQFVDFLYADVGGTTSVLTGVALGLSAWWALSPAAMAGAAADGGAPDGAGGPEADGRWTTR